MKRFPWRSLLYALVLLYLILDLKVWNGPLKNAIASRGDASVSSAVEQKWVAIVNQEPITQDQLHLAVFRHLYQRGKEPGEIPEKNLIMIRRAVLQTLIDDTLVRQYADGEKFEAPPEEIDAFIESWESQFTSDEDLSSRSDLQNLDPPARRDELARIWSRKRWLEKRIAPGIDVTDEEMREWFDANRETGEGFVEPEKVHARHLFLSTVETDDETREELIVDLHRQITEKENTFDDLTKTYSDDPRTKHRGGDLSWFAKDRVPQDFGEFVFAMKPGDISEPFKSAIGWHIVEVLDKQPERPLEFHEIADEVRHHLENQRTVDTIKVLMKKLRTVANIKLFPEHI